MKGEMIFTCLVLLVLGQSLPVQATSSQFTTGGLHFPAGEQATSALKQEQTKLHSPQQLTEPYYLCIYTHILLTNPSMDNNLAYWLAGTIIENSLAEGVDPLLATAVFTQESQFNIMAQSKKGAWGIAQLMPDTASMLGVDYTDPAQNIAGGIRYLSEQLHTFQTAGIWAGSYAVAAYNAGPEAVKLYGGIPPYRETENYVSAVGAIYARLVSKLETFKS
jgi:hypothetical protein